MEGQKVHGNPAQAVVAWPAGTPWFFFFQCQDMALEELLEASL